MPVHRFRTHDEARRAQQLAPGDPRLAERIRQVLDMGARLFPVVRPPGVHRFTSHAEANAWRAAWKRARADGGPSG